MKCDKHRTFLPIDESQLEIAPVVAHGWIVSVSGCKARINLFDLGHVVTPHWSLVDVAFWVGKTQRKPSAITVAICGRRRATQPLRKRRPPPLRIIAWLSAPVSVRAQKKARWA